VLVIANGARRVRVNIEPHQHHSHLQRFCALSKERGEIERPGVLFRARETPGERWEKVLTP